jgi:hypothetical protein
MNILKHQVNNMAKEVKMVSTAEEVEQIENSALLACDFIYETLLPLLDEFENDNDDPEYIPGVATHGLFIALIQELADLGYTQKDLNKEIKTYMNTSLGEVVH